MTAAGVDSDYNAELVRVVLFLECLLEACVEQAEVTAAVDLAPALSLLRQLQQCDQVEAAIA